jgi:hypothetical protein
MAEADTTTASTTPPPKPDEGSLRPALDMSKADYEAARRKLTGVASRDLR